MWAPDFGDDTTDYDRKDDYPDPLDEQEKREGCY